MNYLETQKFEELKDLCEEKFAGDQPWDSFYERRYLEFLSYYEYLKNFKTEHVLEIGCGLGYCSALLSKISGSVVATDLAEESLLDHAIGLDRPKNFLQNLSVKNVQVLPASAEELPFPDNSFDLVFSSHVLEHVPNKEKAVREINRVLRPGGIHFCVTPTRSDLIYYLFIHYAYLGKRAIHHVQKFFSKKKIGGASPQAEKKVPLGSSVRQQLKHFPFPPVHGNEKHYLLELKKWSFSDWKSLLTNGGKIPLVGQYSTQINPIFILGSIISPALALKAHRFTRVAEISVGQGPFKWLGINCITITRKL